MCCDFDVDQCQFYEMFEMADIKAIGHSQGIIPALFMYGFNKIPESSRDDTNQSTMKFLKPLIQLTTIIAIYSAINSSKIRSLLYSILPTSPVTNEFVSCMISVAGLSKSELEKELWQVNKRIQKEVDEACRRHAVLKGDLGELGLTGKDLVQIALCNGEFEFVVSGPTAALQLFEKDLQARFPLKDRDALNSKLPYSERGPKVVLRQLNISAPFHNHIMKCDYDRIMDASITIMKEIDRIDQLIERSKPMIFCKTLVKRADDDSRDVKSSIIQNVVSRICIEGEDYYNTVNILDKDLILCLGPGSERHAASINVSSAVKQKSVCIVGGPRSILLRGGDALPGDGMGFYRLSELDAVSALLQQHSLNKSLLILSAVIMEL